MSAMVRTLSVTTSPVVPSPRVAARTRRPFVAQRAGQAVDLRLGGERDSSSGGEAQEAADAGEKSATSSSRKGVFEAEHRQRVPHLGQVRGGRRADLARRAVLAHEVRELRLQLGIAPHQRVIFASEISGASSLNGRAGCGARSRARAAPARRLPLLSRSCRLQQPRRLRPRLVGDLRARQHPGDLLAAPGLVERLDAGAGDEALVALLDEEVLAPRAATCGLWVTTRSWALARRWRRSPIALATAPPTPRSISSKIIVRRRRCSASATFSARMKRESSPPLAILVSGANGRAGVGRDLRTRRGRGRPRGPLRSGSGSTPCGTAASSFSGASSRATASRGARGGRARAR
jgi:hypothetical protein